jgi:hypothetical protein
MPARQGWPCGSPTAASSSPPLARRRAARSRCAGRQPGPVRLREGWPGEFPRKFSQQIASLKLCQTDIHEVHHVAPLRTLTEAIPAPPRWPLRIDYHKPDRRAPATVKSTLTDPRKQESAPSRISPTKSASTPPKNRPAHPRSPPGKLPETPTRNAGRRPAPPPTPNPQTRQHSSPSGTLKPGNLHGTEN